MLSCKYIKYNAYKYIVVYKVAKINDNAYGLRRFPIPDISDLEREQQLILLLGKIAASPVTVQQVRRETSQNPSHVREYILSGWPVKPDSSEFRPFYLELLNLLIIVDAYSRWIKAHRMGSIFLFQ